MVMPKILIVDDDVAITELMKTLVTMEGYEPITVNNSMEAMDIAKSVEPDLITLDLMMPGLSGFELCKLLREDPRFNDTPIVIVSAKDDPESKDKALKAGAKDYIIKPFKVDDFINKINLLTTT
jgi:DNA-binding response OmpR family regulator